MSRGRGSLPTTSAGGTVAAHVAEADPHVQYMRFGFAETVTGQHEYSGGAAGYLLPLKGDSGTIVGHRYFLGGFERWRIATTPGGGWCLEAFDAAGVSLGQVIGASVDGAGISFSAPFTMQGERIKFKDPVSEIPFTTLDSASGREFSFQLPDPAGFTASRVLTVAMQDADTTLTLNGDFTIVGDTTISAFGATLVDDADAAAARVTLGAADIVHTHAAADTVSGVFVDARIAESNITQHVAAIDHNSLLNFLITEHRVINDAGTGTTDLWSASKITDELSAAVNSLDFKDAVETVADSDITLSGEQTINGVTTSTSRVGVVGQTLSENNGIYITAAGAWARSTDADVSSEVTQGLTFFVSDTSSTKNGFQYILTTADPIVLDTTPLSFTEVKRIELGTTAGTAAEGNDSRIPVQDENDALIGTNGTPSSANKYVTNSDTRIPVQDENDALVGTNGTPSTANKYVTNSDPRNSDSRVPSGVAGGDLNGTYPNPSVDDGADATAIHDDTSGEIAAIATKATIVGADLVMIEDSEDSNSKAKTTAQDIADLAAGSALTGRLTADQSFTSNTTLADITGVNVTLAANKNYEVEVWIPATTGAGGLKTALNGPTGSNNIRYSVTVMTSSGAGAAGNHSAYNSATGSNSSSTTHHVIKALIENGGTAGSLTLRAAQNNSNGAASTVQRGTIMIAREVT